MMMDEYTEYGKRHRTYYVFSIGVSATDAIRETAHQTKMAADLYECVKGWILGDDLYLEKVKGASMVKVVRRK